MMITTAAAAMIQPVGVINDVVVEVVLVLVEVLVPAVAVVAGT